MSKILEALQNRPDTALGGTDKTFIDADTLAGPRRERYRIQGVDAGEVQKVTNGKLKPGTAGGEVATDVVSALANKQGYTNVVPVLDRNGQPAKDHFGRTLADLKNEKGESFNKGLIDAGAFDINQYSTQQQIASRDIADARRARAKLDGTYTETAFDQAAEMINAAEMAEGEKQRGFKIQALNEVQRANYKAAGLGHMLAGGVQIRNRDVDLDNNSLSPYSDAWDQGWLGAKEGMYGMLNLLGEEYNNEWLADLGEDGINRMQVRQQEYGNILTDYKDVDSISTGLQFLGNNIAMSLPYMAITAAGAGAGAVATAATGGGAAVALGFAAAGAAPAASVYAGQVWNEMEGDKNAGVAVTAGIVQASLDRLGLGGIAAKIVPDKAVAQGIQHIMKKQGVTKEVATQMLAEASKAESRALLQQAIKTTTRQQAAKQTGKDLIKRATIEGGFEGATEVLQEATAYTAATLGSDKQFDWEELNERMVAAAIAGTAIGSTISAPGAMKQALNEYDLLSGAQAATHETASDSALYAEEEKATKGYVPSIQENIGDVRTQLATEGVGFETQQDRAAQYKSKQKDKGFVERATELALNPAALWKGATANIFTPEIQAQSRSARVLGEMFGANIQKIFSGSNFETAKHHKVAMYKNMVDMPDTVFLSLANGRKLNHTTKENISNETYATLNAAVDKDGRFDDRRIPDNHPNKQVLIRLAKQLNTMADAMYADQKKHNPELGYTKNYLMKYKALDKNAVRKNRTKFQELLMSKHKYKRDDAAKLVDEIINNSEVNDVDEAFSVVKGGIVPTSHKKRSLGLSEDIDFNEFMQRDMFANIAQAAKSAARYSAHREFIGKNSDVISKLLDNMEKEGVGKDHVNKVASQLQDYLDAESGNYKRPKTAAGKKAQAVQKNMMMFMTLAGLPLATISSMVELMLVNRGLTTDQVWGKNGSMKSMGTEFAKTLGSAMKTIANANPIKDFDTNPQSAARDQLKQLGFYDWDVGAATVTGVTEVNAWQQRLYENFFKVNGLTGWTNYTRAVRASMAGDFLSENSEIVWKAKTSGEFNRDAQVAEEKLRNLGVDVDKFSEIQTKVRGKLNLTEKEQQFLDDTMREATFNFVNEAIALPQSANRPLLYQDPRFALFTQFQGFLATFTANHIPKLWGEYVKRGTPAMKYNAFATMATMVMMGFASQHLKDLIKYEGEEEEAITGANPYLDSPEYIRRGIMASGLLGTGERLVSAAFPIYEDRSQNTLDWAFNQVTGESPALGWAARLGNAAGHTVSGEAQQGVNQFLKAAPGLGPFSSLNKALSHGVTGNWDYFKE